MNNQPKKIQQSPAILYLLVTLSPLGIDLHLPALVEIKNHFNINNYWAQLSILVFVFSMGIGQLIFGFASENWGKKTVAYIGSLLFIIGSACILLAAGGYVNYHWLLFFRVLQGLGASAVAVIAYATVNENYQADEAAVIFSIQSGFLNVIPALAPVLGALFLQIWGWSLIFIFFTAYGLLTLLQVAKHYHYPQQTAQSRYLTALSALFHDKQFLLFAAVCVYGLAYIMTYLNIAPLLMMEKFASSTLFFAVCFAINATIISAVSFLLKKIIMQLGAFNCVLGGLFFMLMSSLGLWLLSSLMSIVIFWSLIALGSVGFALAFGPAISFALSKHQAYSGIASGVLGFVYLSLAPLVAFVILRYSSIDTSLMGIAFTALGVVLYFYTAKQHSTVPENY